MKGSHEYSHQADSMKRKWAQDNNNNKNRVVLSSGFYDTRSATRYLKNHHQSLGLVGLEDHDLIGSTTVAPQITVVLEGRSICQRISLHRHTSYQSLAKALREMFVEEAVPDHHEQLIALSNAVPGHLVAYEDMEDDLLLVGDLNWKDFVRVAKRIRIIPLKAKPGKGRAGA